jgi:hypothetical protein
MNTQKQSKLRMYLTIRIYLLSNPEITAKIPNFAEFLALFDAAILQIQSNSQQHQFSSKGVAGNKKQLRDALVIMAADASRKMLAYANYVNDAVLIAEIKLSESFLKRISDLRFISSITGLYSRINDHIAKLSTYGLTVESQAIFLEAIDAFKDALTKPRQTQLIKKENTLLELQGFKAADSALHKIDLSIEIIHLTEPNFYMGYKNARKIVEYGTGSLQVQGKVTDAQTTLPIIDASLIFKLNDHSDIAMEKYTAAKGGFMIKTLREGSYEVSISKIGYVTKTITIHVSPDHLNNIDIALDKI